MKKGKGSRIVLLRCGVSVHARKNLRMPNRSSLNSRGRKKNKILFPDKGGGRTLARGREDVCLPCGSKT